MTVVLALTTGGCVQLLGDFTPEGGDAAAGALEGGPGDAGAEGAPAADTGTGERALDSGVVDAPRDAAPDGTVADAGSVDGSILISSLEASAGNAGPDAGADQMSEDATAAEDGPVAHDASSGACADTCVLGQTSCVDGGVATCAVGDGGCLSYGTPAACGAHQSCVVTAGTAACTCNPSICSVAGDMCQSAETAVTCASDANSCLFVASTTSCTAPLVCMGGPLGAACGLTCTDSCVQGQTACVNGGVATCALGADGCFSYGTPQGCPAFERCAGPAGTASCACDQGAACTPLAGNDCQTAAISCATGAPVCVASNLPDQTPCGMAAGEVCTAGACACPPGERVCTNGGSFLSCDPPNDPACP